MKGEVLECRCLGSGLSLDNTRKAAMYVNPGGLCGPPLKKNCSGGGTGWPCPGAREHPQGAPGGKDHLLWAEARGPAGHRIFWRERACWRGGCSPLPPDDWQGDQQAGLSAVFWWGEARRREPHTNQMEQISPSPAPVLPQDLKSPKPELVTVSPNGQLSQQREEGPGHSANFPLLTPFVVVNL